MNQQEVVGLLKRLLRDHQPPGVNIAVVEEGVRQDQNWWYVPVTTEQAGPRTPRYYEALAEVEEELKNHNELDVLLVPVS